MPTQARGEDWTEALYGRAEELLGKTAAQLKAQALLAHEERSSTVAMRVLSFVWGRNARHLSTAVGRWPGYFMAVDGVEPPELEPDEFQVLFMLASLPRAIADELYTKWRRYSWRAWRVREALEDWRAEQKDPRLLRLRGKRVRVLEVQPGEAGTVVQIQFPSGGKTEPKEEWRGRLASVLITELKGEE